MVIQYYLPATQALNYANCIVSIYDVFVRSTIRIIECLFELFTARNTFTNLLMSTSSAAAGVIHAYSIEHSKEEQKFDVRKTSTG